MRDKLLNRSHSYFWYHFTFSNNIFWLFYIFRMNYCYYLFFTFRQAEELKLELENERLAEKSTAAQLTKVLSYEEALQRNANILKVGLVSF